MNYIEPKSDISYFSDVVVSSHTDWESDIDPDE